MNKKTVALLMACVLLVGAAIGGTMAWLVDSTGEVTNTFTVGDINITLKEHDYDPTNKVLITTGDNCEVTENDDYHFVPGDTLPKDPFVRVEEKSEACWLFIKVTENNNIEFTVDATANTKEKALIYNVDTSVWTPVPGHEGYWYCKSDGTAESETETRNILEGNIVRFSDYITKDSGLETALPTITFEAAAIQEAHIADIIAAWDNLPNDFKN